MADAASVVSIVEQLAIEGLRAVMSTSPEAAPDPYNWDRVPGLGAEPIDRRGFFTGWKHPHLNTIQPQAGSAVAIHNQKSDDALKRLGPLSFTYAGTGGQLPNLGPLLRVGLSKEDWFALYRSLPRSLYTFGEMEVHTETETDLTILENTLLDTNQYNGDGMYLTVLVYGEGDYGQASLFQIERKSDLTHPFEGSVDNLSTHIKPLALAPAVPRPLLEHMERISQGHILLHKPRRHGFLRRPNHHTRVEKRGADQPEFYINTVQILGNSMPGAAVPPSSWTIGSGWKGALGIALKNVETEGFRATLPQLLGLVHLRGSGHRNLSSSPAVWFQYDLKRKPIPSPEPQANRFILLETPPDVMVGIQGAKFRIAVLFPRFAIWAKEAFIWG